MQSNPAFPSGGTASTAIFHFHQFGHEDMATTMRGSIATGGCGYFIDNVDNPASPVRVSRTTGADWCTIHETFVSTDANGDADYAWLTGGHESFNGSPTTFIVVLTLGDLSQPGANPQATGRYIKPNETCNSYYFDCQFIHDSNVVGNRAYIGYWNAGVYIFDKETLAHNINPAPLNPVDSIMQTNFSVHHMVPTTDGKFVIAEDEIRGGTGFEKLRLFNVEDVANPVYVGGVTGGDPNSELAQAHNQIIKNLGPHHDLLLSAWYKAGYRLYDVDSSGSTPIVTLLGGHGLRTSGLTGFGGVWGVDSLPCTVRGVQTTCIYSSDMTYGLVVDALGVNPAFDPYAPDAQITSPTQGQEITTCSFTIQGTAHDYWSGLSTVEVSVDNGATWQAATGTTTWSYQWNIPASGQYNILVRATDNANNVYTSTVPITVNVTATCAEVTNTPTPVPPTATQTSISTSTPSFTPSPTPTPFCFGSGNSPLCTPTAPPNTATPTPTACAIEFTDVPVGSTFYPYIHCLACQGIVNGYPDHTFRPNNNVTRGQAAKMVAPCGPTPCNFDQQTFEDVPPGSTFYNYVERLAQASIVGYACGGPGEPCVPPENRPYFRPNNNLTRGQLVKLISSVAGWNDAIPSSQQSFQEVPFGSTFWIYVERFMLHVPGGITGYPCGGPGEPCVAPENRPYFRPSNNVTRGQTSKLLTIALHPECPTLR